MPTLRLIKPQEYPAPADGDSGPPRPSLSPPSPTMSDHPETVPIRFESLPTPLRAVVRDQADGSLRIEAELPWLAVGTMVHGGPPGGVERTAQVSDFDVEVTSGGSARLVILTAPSNAPVTTAPAASPATKPPRRRFGKFVVGAIVIGATAVAGYVLGQLSSPAIVLESARPTSSIPTAPPLPAPPAPPAPSLEATPPELSAPPPTLTELPQPSSMEPPRPADTKRAKARTRATRR